MSVKHLATLAGTVIAGAALGVAAFATAATAAADSTDDNFLAGLQSFGITVQSPQAAVQAADSVCQSLANGDSPPAVTNDILSATDLQPREGMVFVTLSVKNYCPQYKNELFDPKYNGTPLHG